VGEAVKALRKSGALQKDDGRILCDSNFIELMLFDAKQEFQGKYWLMAKSVNIEIIT